MKDWTAAMRLSPHDNAEKHADESNPLTIIISSAVSGDVIETAMTMEPNETVAMLRQRLQHRNYVKHQKGLRIQFVRDDVLLDDENPLKTSSHDTGPILLTRVDEDVETCYCGTSSRDYACFCAACGIFVCEDCNNHDPKDIFCCICSKYCCTKCVRERQAAEAWSCCRRCGLVKCTVCVRLSIHAPCSGCLDLD